MSLEAIKQNAESIIELVNEYNKSKKNSDISKKFTQLSLNIKKLVEEELQNV